MRLQGQTALVTGGGRGIGRAIALALAQEGVQTFVSARTRSDVEEVMGEIRARGGLAVAVTGDVTVSRDVEAMVA
jgi:3-oxoacyl-[acyl-carrier protein] reductase